jgi:hypothetical protein
MDPAAAHARQPKRRSSGWRARTARDRPFPNLEAAHLQCGSPPASVGRERQPMLRPLG